MVYRSVWLAEVLNAILFCMPGWISLLIASAVYAFLNFGPTYIDVHHYSLDYLEKMGPRLAPWLAGFILFVGIVAQIYKRSRRRRQPPPSKLEMIRALSWEDFEKQVCDAYRRRGYRVEKRSGSKGTKEAYLVLRRQGELVLIHCQQWKAKEVGISAVRSFYRAMAREQATFGILVTCGQFTPQALAFVQGKPLALVEGIALLERIGQLQQGRKKAALPPAKRGSLPK
jgi:restriction system protein